MVRVLFLHPDLGIGGAERLVVDAALALKERGHDVSFLTNHHSPAHCFRETVDGSFEVRVVGDWLPRQICGRFYAFCAYLRMLYAAFYASFVMSRERKIDVFFCDLISVGIPVLRWARHNPKVLFYCHFPDQLLSKKEGVLKSLYRAPINYLEEWTVGMADISLVNSKFTLRVFQETFRGLHKMPEVLYPSLHTAYFDKMQQQLWAHEGERPLPGNIPRNSFVFLDINRYERKKNHALALEAFKEFTRKLTPAELKRCRLVVAGGYDPQNAENVEHFEELEQLLRQLKIEAHATLLRSPSNDEKFQLLDGAQCVLYTPENEHFGIVPLEAMYMSKPVIALNSGGPMETIINNSTGILCERDASAMAAAMWQLYSSDALRERMGDMGRKRVEQKFSFESFADKLDEIVVQVVKKPKGAAKRKDN